jgi:membrane dipeptidase
MKTTGSGRPSDRVLRMNRRQVLQRLGVFSVAGVPLLGQGTDSASFLSQHPAFDLHCHPGALHRRGLADYPGDQAFMKTTSEMRAGGLAAAFFSIVGDAKLLTRDAKGIVVSNQKLSNGEAWADCEKQLKAFDELAKRENIGLATSTAQMQKLRKRGQIAAFLSCEGGHGLEGRLDRLDDLYAHGVRSLQLTHYAQNTLGDLQTLPPVYNGLSTFGRDVVRRVNHLGMVVDVAHASFLTVKATVDITTAPIMLSHSHLQSETSPHPRLITVEHARLVSSTGGLIGAWPSGFANRTFADFVDQTMRLIDAVGIDHVGLGTDMDGNFEPVFSNYRQLPDWVTGLRSKGLSEADLAKVVGGNAVRVLGQVLKT